MKSIQEQIAAVLAAVREQPSTRESSLVATKLQEAMMWQKAHEEELLRKTRQAGVGFNPDVHGSQNT